MKVNNMLLSFDVCRHTRYQTRHRSSSSLRFRSLNNSGTVLVLFLRAINSILMMISSIILGSTVILFLRNVVVRAEAAGIVDTVNIDPICNHDGGRESHCGDKNHQWMALLSRDYCCADILPPEKLNSDCYWFGMLLYVKADKRMLDLC